MTRQPEHSSAAPTAPSPAAASSRSQEGAAPAITRRQLLTQVPATAAGLAAVAAVGAAVAASGCSSGSGSKGPQLDVLEVPVSAVTTLESYKEVTNPSKLYALEEELSLPRGSQLFGSGSKRAAVLVPGASSRPLSSVALLELSTMSMHTVLEEPVGQDEGFNFHELRCSDGLLLWVESNFLTDAWRVYSASIAEDGASVSEPVLLDEGDGEYDAPEIAVAANQAYWIVQPAEAGSKTQEDSLLKTNGGIAFTSRGRFNAGLSTSGNTLVCMPRAEATGTVYYQLTAIQGGGVIASQVLPHGFRPNTFTYVDGRFSFGIPAGYDYGDGIANVGTYLSLGDGSWLRLTRTPVTPAGRVGGWLFCKSSSRTVFVDAAKKRYFTINPPSGSESYGDYAVRTGELDDTLYLYSTVKDTGSKKSSRKVVLRSVKLKSI